MEATTALAELEALAKKLEVEVVYDHLTGEGAGSGGLCKIKGRWRVIIERRSSAGERLSILAKALSRFDLDSHYLTPSLRELVERYLPPERRPRPPEEPAADERQATPVAAPTAEEAPAEHSAEEQGEEYNREPGTGNREPGSPEGAL
jgi:hypothetical protein